MEELRTLKLRAVSEGVTHKGMAVAQNRVTRENVVFNNDRQSPPPLSTALPIYTSLYV